MLRTLTEFNLKVKGRNDVDKRHGGCNWMVNMN